MLEKYKDKNIGFKYLEKLDDLYKYLWNNIEGFWIENFKILQRKFYAVFTNINSHICRYKNVCPYIFSDNKICKFINFDLKHYINKVFDFLSNNNIFVNIFIKKIKNFTKIFTGIKNNKKWLENTHSNYNLVNKNKLNLIFNTKVEEIIKNYKNLTLKYQVNNRKQKENYDCIIRSIGFESNKIELKTTKPVFYVGWCRKSTGSIDSALRDSKMVVDEIMNFFKLKNNIR